MFFFMHQHLLRLEDVFEPETAKPRVLKKQQQKTHPHGVRYHGIIIIITIIIIIIIIIIITWITIELLWSRALALLPNITKSYQHGEYM